MGILIRGTVLFGIAGIALHFLLGHFEKNWQRKKDLVDSGKIPAKEAILKRKYEQRSRSSSGNGEDVDYWIELMRTDNGDLIHRNPTFDEWDQMAPATRFTVYPVEGEYFIPVLDTGGFKEAKTGLLQLSFVPLILVLLFGFGRKMFKLVKPDAAPHVRKLSGASSS